MKNKYCYALLLSLALALPLSAGIIKQQSFESAVSDTWEYTVNPGTYYNGPNIYSIWSIDNTELPAYCQPQDGDWLWNAEYTTHENSDIHTMTFSTVDLTNYTNLTLRFYYNAFYFGGTGTGKWKGTGDVLGYYVEYDNGTTWNSSNYTTIVSSDGTVNLSGTGGWVEVPISIPEGSDYLRLQFCVKNSEASEVATFDYITLEGTEVPTPITLADFNAETSSEGVKLSWKTATEIENRGFNLYRNNEMIAFIPGAGTTSEYQNYTYTDKTVIPGNTYTYLLADISYANVENKYDQMARTVYVNEASASDLTYKIGNAYPNPFNPSTTLEYELLKAASVEIGIYNMTGEKVAELVNGNQTAGSYLVKWDASNMESGIYLLKSMIGNLAHTQKLLLIK